MKRYLPLLLLLLLPSIAWAQQDAKPTPAPTAKADAAAAPATQPATPPTAPADGVAKPTTTEEAVEAGKDFIGAIKGKRWWFAAAGGIFLLLFVLGMFGVWTKIGTTWAWVAVGVLSLAAGCFAAFDAKGFNWGTLLGYMTAGPTIAWIRDWVKDGILKIKKKE